MLQWILAGGAVALLLPVLILIAMASRLSANQARRTLRGHAPRGGHTASGIGGRHRRSIHRRACGRGGWVRAVLRCSSAPLSRTFHRVSTRAWRPLPQLDRCSAGGDRRPDRGRSLRAPRSTTCPHLTPGCEPTRIILTAAQRPDHPSSGRRRHLVLFRRFGKAGRQRHSNSRDPGELRAYSRRARARRTVVHHRGIPGDGRPGEPAGNAHCRPYAPRQPESCLPLHMRARHRAIRHECGSRSAQLDNRGRRLVGRQRGNQHDR